MLSQTRGLDVLLDDAACGLVEVKIGAHFGSRVTRQRREGTERYVQLLHRREPRHLAIRARERGSSETVVARAREVRVIGHGELVAPHHLSSERRHIHVVENHLRSDRRRRRAEHCGLESTRQIQRIRRQCRIGINELAGGIEHGTCCDQRAACWIGNRVGSATRRSRRNDGNPVEGDIRLCRLTKVIVGELGTQL